MNAHPVVSDVIVVGGGNAALTAAIAAAARGRSVRLLERADPATAGGNSYYTAGATRITHNGLDDLRDLVDFDDRHSTTEVPPYRYEDYVNDLKKVTDGRGDAALGHVLASEARAGLDWLKAEHGMRYRLMYERQAYLRPDGSHLFWGGLHVGNVGGGEGLIADATAAAVRAGVEFSYEHHVTEFLVEGGRVVGVTAETPQGRIELRAESVILAAGGFESSAELREAHLGKGWSNAVVRGTPLNTGELLLKAIELGAARGGDWSTCHSTAWDAWYPDNASNRELTNRLTRQSYPLGIVVNREGERFIDEGADFRNYTYAKYGREILAQTGFVAYQVYDATLRTMLRTEEYDMPGVSVVVADSIPELAEGLGIEPAALASTVRGFNDSIDRSIQYDPTVKDAREAKTRPPKSNWAQPIETAPFYAYPVTCGITFTFGGLRSDLDGRVLDTDGVPIPGLLVCGEALGGLFAGNYPGGSGLAAGIVFGRRAGAIA